MKITEKIDIVVQGPYTDFTDSVVKHYLNIPFVNNVIVSCWETDKNPIKRRNVKYVRNKHPFSPGTDNKNLQIVSSLNGLKECTTNFSVKVRSDQKFTIESMIQMYNFFMIDNGRRSRFMSDQFKPNNRIFVAGYYPNYLFACRDHIFWGHTDDLIDLFDIPLEQNSLIDKVKIPKEILGNYCDYFTRTETYIGAHYCSKFNPEIYRILLTPEQHLYDNSIYWYYTKEISNQITPIVFKSFPKSAIDLEWKKSPELNFGFDLKSFLSCGLYDEDGY